MYRQPCNVECRCIARAKASPFLSCQSATASFIPQALREDHFLVLSNLAWSHSSKGFRCGWKRVAPRPYLAAGVSFPRLFAPRSKAKICADYARHDRIGFGYHRSTAECERHNSSKRHEEPSSAEAYVSSGTSPTGGPCRFTLSAVSEDIRGSIEVARLR